MPLFLPSLLHFLTLAFTVSSIRHSSAFGIHGTVNWLQGKAVIASEEGMALPGSDLNLTYQKSSTLSAQTQRHGDGHVNKR